MTKPIWTQCLESKIPAHSRHETPGVISQPFDTHMSRFSTGMQLTGRTRTQLTTLIISLIFLPAGGTNKNADKLAVNAQCPATDRNSIYCYIVLVPCFKIFFETNTHTSILAPFSLRFSRCKYRPLCPTPQACRPPGISIILYPFLSLSIFATVKISHNFLTVSVTALKRQWKMIARLQPAKSRCVLECQYAALSSGDRAH